MREGPWSRLMPPTANGPSCRTCGPPAPTTCWPSSATSAPCMRWCKTTARPSSATAVAASGVLARCWAVPGLGKWLADPKAWLDLHSLIRALLHIEPACGCRGPTGADPRPLAGTLWARNGLHRTLDVQFREDDCRLRRGHAPVVMGILCRAVLNMGRTVQQNFRLDLSIGLLRNTLVATGEVAI